MKKKKYNSLENEWVIKLVDSAEKAVKGYEKYLLDKINYSELAKLMTDLREILPEGCYKKDDNDENNKKNN